MAFFDSLKNSLKQKWLQYFQSNRCWISLYSGIATPDGGRRPPSYLILGVINALEPQLKELMLPFSKLNPNADILIDVLGLNFDPDLMLGNVSPAVVEVSHQQVQVDDLLQADFDKNESFVGIDETDAFTVTSLAQITFDDLETETLDNNVAINSSDDFGDGLLNVESESSLELDISDETQSQNTQDISGLFG